MKLTFKIYLKSDADFQVDAEPSDTIGDLKAKIKESHGYDIDIQNILFLGRNLENDRTIESCKISGAGFLLLTLSGLEGPLPVPEVPGAEEFFNHPEKYDIDLSILGPPHTKRYSNLPIEVLPDYPGNTPAADATTVSGSMFKYIHMPPSTFDPEFMSTTPMPPVTTASTFKYRPFASSSSALPPDAATSSTPLPPTTSTSTFKPVSLSSSIFDSESMSTIPLPPVTTTSTFKYRSFISSTSAPGSTSPSDAASQSTSKYRPFTSSIFDSEPMSSTPLPLVTTASTFKYRSFISSASTPGSTSTSDAASQSTFKSRPFTSSTSISGSASTSNAASQSTFKHRPMTSSLSSPTLNAGTPTTTPHQGGILGAGSGSSTRPNNSQIAQFRELITQNPQLKQQFLQQLSQDNPELGQMLTQNPDLLSHFLSSMEGGEGIPSIPPARLNITDADQDAIERLGALGYPKQAVIEAYLACDKNEELAANYLVENP